MVVMQLSLVDGLRFSTNSFFYLCVCERGA